MNVQVLSQDFAAWPPTEETVRCPFDYFAALRESAPVYRFPEPGPFGSEMYVVTRWEDCAEALLRPEVFANNLDGGPEAFETTREPLVAPDVPTFYQATNVFFSDGDDHQLKRSWVMPLVTRDRLSVVRPIITAEVDLLIDSFIAAGRCDFRGQFSDVMPMKVVRQVMGLPEDADPKIKRLSAALEINDNNPHQTDEMVTELRAARMDILTLIADVLRVRHAAPIEGDYVSELIQRQVVRDGVLDINALTMHLAATVFGADHAMGGHLADIAARLGREPKLQDRLREDRSLIRALSSEALRIESPLPWLFRRCAQDTTLGGVPIPAGAIVLIVQVSANHDPREFPEPGAFDIDRPNIERDHLTLGRGRHRCAGAEMAKLQVDITVNRLLDRLADIRLDDEKSDLLPKLSYGFRIPTAVHLTFRAAD
ncbi:cytochrome P450 [Rhodococcus sp. NPDC057529]|uniref:cytochrome P450 n=1 Tax=Rhodococcus sp. NPDC057529 TaxID=3346158 RepID=UPI00366BBB46